MPLHSIDYLNARRDAKPASGGRNYLTKRNPVDERAQYAELDPLERAHLDIERTFADFRSWFRNLPSVEMLMSGEAYDEIPF